MLDSEVIPGRTTPRSAAPGWTGLLLAVLAGWILAAYPGIVFHLTARPDALFLGADGAMRMVQVRDLLAGQGWFDLVQRRLGPGDGIEMHWSRLVDAPLAGLILALQPMLGREMAETATAVIWPVLLPLPAVLAAALAGRALAGSAGTWLASGLMGLHLGNSARFVPGQIDHHNLQLVLFVVAASLAPLASRSQRAAALLGVAIGTSLAIGVELLPMQALLILAVAVLWADAGPPARPILRRLALSLTATMVVWLFLASPRSALAGGYCDALGRDLVLPASTGALGLFAAATLWSEASRAWRFLSLAGAALATLALAVAVAPACLSDPLGGIDPYLRAHWLNRVAEAQGWAGKLTESPATELPVLAAVLVGVAAASFLFFLRPAGERWVWAVQGGILVIGLLLALWQLRATMVLGPLSVLPVAVLGAELLSRGRGSGLAAITLIALASPPGWTVVLGASRAIGTGRTSGATPAAAVSRSGLWDCFAPGAMSALAELPPGLVSASSNLGSHILLSTPHRVLSAPYHRNTAGMTEQLRIEFASDSEAEDRLRHLGVDYVAICTTDPISATEPGTTPPGFAFRLAKGEEADFLEPVPRVAGPGLHEDPERSVIRVYRLTAAR